MSNVYDIRIEANSGTNFTDGIVVFTTNAGESNITLSSDNMNEGTNSLFYTEDRVNNNTNVILGSEAYNWGNHTTAGFVYQNYFDNVTSGINDSIDVLETQVEYLYSNNDYTTAGLASTNYVDSGDLNLQNQIDNLPQGSDHTTAGYLTSSEASNTYTTITNFNNATSGINNELDNVDSRLDILESNSIHSPDYTTAGLATVNYVDNADSFLQLQIDNINSSSGNASLLNDLLDVTILSPIVNDILQYSGSNWVNIPLLINDYTTAGLVTTNYVDNTFVTITEFDSATSGINNELDNLDNRIDSLELNNPDHTTAGYATTDYVDNTFVTITEFNNATNGINDDLDSLQTQIGNLPVSNDYTTAGLTTQTYVDNADNNLQLQIDNLDIKDHTTAGYSTQTYVDNTFVTITEFDNATSGINDRLDILESNSTHSPDYTTAGLASVTYVDSGDSNLQFQIDNLDIKDHTTAGYLTSSEASNTYTTITDFNNATSGINNELDNLQVQIDNLPQGNDHTTAGYSTQTYVDSTFTTLIEFDSATSGINDRLDILESNSTHSPDYTTAGLTTQTYVDSGDSNLQVQIDNLDIKDHTTAGYLTSTEASNTYTTISQFNNATSGINNELDNLQVQIDNLPVSNDYTTAGLSTVTYVDSTFTTLVEFNNATSGINNELNNLDNRIDNLELNNPDYTTAGLATTIYVDNADSNLQLQIDNLDIKDHTTAGYTTQTYVDNTFVTITDFNNATSGINNELGSLQTQIDTLPVSNDYTTAGLATITYVDSGDLNLQNQIDNLPQGSDHTTAGYLTSSEASNTYTTITDFNNATSGINDRLDVLESNSIDSPNYTTAGLATTIYVDNADSNLQLQIDNLQQGSDHTTAGYATQSYVDTTFTTITDFNNATSGINNVLDDKVVWLYPYTSNTYPKNVMTRVEVWTTISNKLTSDFPTPTEVGSHKRTTDNATFTEFNNSSVVYSGHTYTFNESGSIKKIYAYVPELTTNTNYNIVIEDITDPLTPIRTVFRDPILSENSWKEVAIGEYFVTPNTILKIYLDSLNSASNNIVSGGWTYNGASNNSAPNSQGWNRVSNNTTVRIDKTDLNSIDRSTELLGIGVGSEILFVDTINTSNLLEYDVVGSAIDQGSYVEYPTTLKNSSGTITNTTTTTMTATIPTVATTKYSMDSDFWVSNPPLFTDVVGFLEYDGVDQINNGTNAFGIDIEFQQLNQSPDWDIVTVTGLKNAVNINDEQSGVQATSVSSLNEISEEVWSENDIIRYNGTSWSLDNVFTISDLDLNKGDIVSYNGTSYEKLELGIDGQVLGINTSTDLGIEWVTNTSSLDHTTAGYATTNYVDNTYTNITDFNNATSGINNRINNLETQEVNLGYTPSGSNGIITSNLGTDATILSGSTSFASLMIPSDKIKLDTIDGIASQLEVDNGTNFSKIVTPKTLGKGLPNGVAILDAFGKVENSQLSGGGKSMILSFGSNTTYEVNSSSATYEKVATFIYAGSSDIGTITDFVVNVWRTGGSGMDIRIYDASNALQIAELLNVTSTSELNFQDMGAVSNIPTALSIFELQIRRVGGGAKGFCGSIEIKY